MLLEATPAQAVRVAEALPGWRSWDFSLKCGTAKAPERGATRFTGTRKRLRAMRFQKNRLHVGHRELPTLAEAAKDAADRAASAIDDALAFIEESNLRIAALEAERFIGRKA